MATIVKLHHAIAVLHDAIAVLHDAIVVLHDAIVVLHDVIVVFHDIIVVHLRRQENLHDLNMFATSSLGSMGLGAIPRPHGNI